MSDNPRNKRQRKKIRDALIDFDKLIADYTVLQTNLERIRKDIDHFTEYVKTRFVNGAYLPLEKSFSISLLKGQANIKHGASVPDILNFLDLI
ncbi:MAG: hypothetical protein ACK5GK_02225, partial [Akkermansiaceae bacterium]